MCCGCCNLVKGNLFLCRHLRTNKNLYLDSDTGHSLTTQQEAICYNLVSMQTNSTEHSTLPVTLSDNDSGLSCLQLNEETTKDMADDDDLSILGDEPFADLVSNLLDLVENRNELSFLLGAGCSKCAGLPLTVELIDKIQCHKKLGPSSKRILKKVRTAFSKSDSGNIEDYISELVDLLAIAERRSERGLKDDTIQFENTSYTADKLRESIKEIKIAISHVIQMEFDINTHRRFIKSMHKPVRVGKSQTSLSVIDYIVLNYDTIIEDALALEEIKYADGLFGGATAWWDPDTFEDNGLQARVIKIHGSIDWYELSDNSMPVRIRRDIKDYRNEERRIIIWPASTKYQETQLDPFAGLANRMRRAMMPNSGKQRLLVICGYAFKDNHINSEIDRALRESNGDLTVVIFTNENELTGQVREWNTDKKIKNQVLIYGNRGFFHGDITEESKIDLLWWKFENLTRILRREI